VEPASPSASAPPLSSLKADAALLALTALWGLTFALIKDVLAQTDPYTFLSLRFSLGAVAAGLMAGRRLLHGPSVRAGLTLAPLLFLGFVLQTVGLRYTTASRSAFLTGLLVVWVPFLQVWLFRTWPKITSWLGVACSAVGLYLLSGGFDAEIQATTLKGDLLTLGCSVAYALHLTLNGRLAARSKVTALVAVQMGGVAVLSMACLPFVDHHLLWSPKLLVGLAFTGLFASALGFNVQAWAQLRTTAVRAALILSLEPLFAAVYAFVLLHESLTPNEWVGGSLIVLGILLAEVGAALLERRRGKASAAGAA